MFNLKKMFKNKDNNEVKSNDKMVEATIKKALSMKLPQREIIHMIQLLSPQITSNEIKTKIKNLS